jgi:hypothetical protein
VSVFAHEHVRSVQRLYADALGADVCERSGHKQIELLAELLIEGHRAHHPGAYVELHNWHPALTHTDKTDMWKLALDPADFVLAVSREHGYPDAADVTHDDTRPDPAFEATVDAMLRGDLQRVKAALDADPALSRASSHWPHRATLLHYATANGVETYRQVVPANLPDLVTLLVDRGADVNATAFAYGGTRRPLGLLRSSAHPRLAGVADDVGAILSANGAT